MELLLSVARFDTDSDRSNFNCNRDVQNSKSEKDENVALGITHVLPLRYLMKTYNNLYRKLCSMENLELAFHKARRRKTKTWYVMEFGEHLQEELDKLHQELVTFTYQPQPLTRFIVRDPKTRTIHASHFRDRVVYHALVNMLEPIFEKIFIYDSYANRVGKGTHKGVKRFDYFKRKVSNNGQLIRNFHSNNSIIGFALKADIRHYFDAVDHEILLHILGGKIKDENVMWLIQKILNNFDTKIKGKGMPLGNLTSQFFANVYLNELDYFVKHKLMAKYYLRYVDDFILLHKSRETLQCYKEKIEKFLMNLKLELHPDKTKIIPLRNGGTMLGYRNFHHYKLLRKSNIRKFEKEFSKKIRLYREGILSEDNLLKELQGWFGYARWANTYSWRKKVLEKVIENGARSK